MAVTIALRRHYFGIAMSLEGAIHRGHFEDVIEWEHWIALYGKAPDVAWLLETYAQMEVPEPYRRCDEVTLAVRTAAYGEEVTVEDVCQLARAARLDYLAAVRANSEAGLIPRGWVVLDGDPPAERDR